jgi:hypothetical protein
MSLLDEFDRHFSGEYKTNRSTVQDAERLTISHLDQQVHVDFFTTGKIKVSGRKCSIKEKVVEVVSRVEGNPHFFDKVAVAVEALTPEQIILKTIDGELYAFLPDHDRLALLAAYHVLFSEIPIPDFSPVTMPVARVYEGFLAKVLVRLGLCTQTAVESPNFKFEPILDSADAKAFKAKVTTHAGEVDSAKQRLKEFRHIQLDSQSSQFVRSQTVAEARRFTERVLNDMQSLFDYFKKFFVP